MMSLWDALRMNMMISYQELVRTFPNSLISFNKTVNGKENNDSHKKQPTLENFMDKAPINKN